RARRLRRARLAALARALAATHGAGRGDGSGRRPAHPPPPGGAAGRIAGNRGALGAARGPRARLGLLLRQSGRRTHAGRKRRDRALPRARRRGAQRAARDRARLEARHRAARGARRVHQHLAGAAADRGRGPFPVLAPAAARESAAMSMELAERRKKTTLTLFVIAAALIAIAAITVAIEQRSLSGDSASGPVAPGLEETIGRAQRIIVTSNEASYRIERTQRGWAMRDRGDYPVLSSRLAQLTDGLKTLRYTRRMTSDESKHERLGVTDPREGGDGILVQIEDSRGAPLRSLLLGVQPH